MRGFVKLLVYFEPIGLYVTYKLRHFLESQGFMELLLIHMVGCEVYNYL